jgi:peroxiredoxin
MKLHSLLVLAAAALLPAQSPAKPKPATAKADPAAASAPATLADLQRDFQDKKLAALDNYLKAHAAAKDSAEALVEAAQLAATLGRHVNAIRYADRYLQEHADGPAASEMRMTRVTSLRDSGDVAAAEKTLRELVDKAGDDINALVEAATMLGDLLVESGKKADAVTLLDTIGGSRPQVRGLKEHFAGIVANYELIGTDPTAIGKSDLAGKAIDLAEYKGKVVLLDFWATWCGPCVQELPNVIAAYDKFHDRGFEIVGISLDQDRGKLDKFLESKKMPWRQYFDGKGWQNEVAAAYGVKSIPATYLIGADGKIAAVGLRGEELARRLARFYPADKAPAPAKK